MNPWAKDEARTHTLVDPYLQGLIKVTYISLDKWLKQNILPRLNHVKKIQNHSTKSGCSFAVNLNTISICSTCQPIIQIFVLYDAPLSWSISISNKCCHQKPNTEENKNAVQLNTSHLFSVSQFLLIESPPCWILKTKLLKHFKHYQLFISILRNVQLWLPILNTILCSHTITAMIPSCE